MPYVPTCHVLFMLTCSRVKVPCVFMCSHANVSCMLTCQRALRAYVLTCQHAFLCFRAYVPTCSGAITINNKNKLSIICFLYIFVIDLSFLFLLNKNVIHSCIALIRRNPLTGAVTDFVKKKVVWFFFERMLRVTIKWWILVCGS